MRRKRRRKNALKKIMLPLIMIALIVGSLIAVVKSLNNNEQNNQGTVIADNQDSNDNSNGNHESNNTENNSKDAGLSPDNTPQKNTSKEYKEINAAVLSIDSECTTTKYNFAWEVFQNNTKLSEFKRDYSIVFPSSDEYTSLQGITTFRGNNYRDTASYGYADIKEEKLEAVWSIKIGYIDTWTGVGWTGQPSIIKWDEDTKKIMNIYDSKKQKEDLKEIIYATLDGNIYFLDLDDGTSTRDPINTGYPYKGSISIDPRGYPLLYAGQGIDTKGGVPVEIGFRIYSLIDHSQLYFLDGRDRLAYRGWAAFDSSCLVDSKTDTLIETGENGLLYTMKLNTNYDKENGKISISPEINTYRYKSVKNVRIGTENSPAAYRNFVYFVDNEGIMQCVDINTLSPVWIRDVTDDTDSTIVIEEKSDNEVYLYTGSEVDIEKVNKLSYIRKINALTGELIWENSYKCIYNSETNGGVLSSPVLGKHEIDNLVIFNIAKTDNDNVGKLIAFDKNTGKEVWVYELAYYPWSSPVAVYTKEGKAYIIQCDSGGYMHLIEGKTGKTLDKLPLGGNVEASPAVYENMIVIGTRGQKIWGVKIK